MTTAVTFQANHEHKAIKPAILSRSSQRVCRNRLRTRNTAQGQSDKNKWQSRILRANRMSPNGVPMSVFNCGKKSKNGFVSNTMVIVSRNTFAPWVINKSGSLRLTSRLDSYQIFFTDDRCLSI